MPRTHVAIEITIPDTIPLESLQGENLPGWDSKDQSVSRNFGDQWLEEQRSAVLLVPSIVTGGREHNVLINPGHRDFVQIVAGRQEDVQWDKRLFQRK